jgi:hypothetical protein
MKKIDDPVIVVDVDGDLIVSVGVGSIENVKITCENKQHSKLINDALFLRMETEIIWGTKPIKAGYETELSLLAALFSVLPGRTYVKECSEELKRQLDEIAKLPPGAIA